MQSMPDEVEDLKAEVMAECEIMAKLRNPFIANYMGSVTYIPQISMVIQYYWFVLKKMKNAKLRLLIN